MTILTRSATPSGPFHGAYLGHLDYLLDIAPRARMNATGGELANGPIATDCHRFVPHRRRSMGKRAVVGLGSIDRDVQNSAPAAALAAQPAPVETRKLIVSTHATDGATAL